MTIINIEGVKYPIDVTSIEYLRSVGGPVAEKTAEKLLIAGGAAATSITRETLDQLIADPTIPEVFREEAKGYQPGPVIIVLQDMFKMFTPDEEKAILLHEECHILENDIEPNGKDNIELHGTKFIVDADIELRADAYAAERVSKEAMRGALIKVVSKTSAFLARKTYREHSEVESEMFSGPTIAKRLEALS